MGDKWPIFILVHNLLSTSKTSKLTTLSPPCLMFPKGWSMIPWHAKDAVSWKTRTEDLDQRSGIKDRGSSEKKKKITRKITPWRLNLLAVLLNLVIYILNLVFFTSFSLKSVFQSALFSKQTYTVNKELLKEKNLLKKTSIRRVHKFDLK